MLEKSDIPLETDKNRVSVGRVGRVDDFSYAFYNPHNARFYFNFMKWNFHPDMTLFKVINSKELTCEFMDCRIVVKKNLIEIVNKINKERRFKIDGSLDHRRDAVVQAVSILELESIMVLKAFIKQFGGTSDCVCVKHHVPDNKILHDKIVDSIPDEVTFRNDVVKKVYKVKPKNVEVNTPEGASKTFRNLALFDFAPEIANQLKDIKDERLEFSKALALYTEQINLHLEVERRQLDVQSETSIAIKQLSFLIRKYLKR
jgi:hypothetical protein